MNSLEMRKYLGTTKMNFVTKKVSKQETLDILQNVDWNSVEEIEACPISFLQTYVTNTIDFINNIR
jgi:hypothetical protein